MRLTRPVPIQLGLVAEEKIVWRSRGRNLTAELARDYAGRIPVLFLGKVVAVTRIERVTRGL